MSRKSSQKRSKREQNGLLDVQHTRQVTDARRKRGSKLPTPELQRVLDLVNLVPPDIELGNFPIPDKVQLPPEMPDVVSTGASQPQKEVADDLRSSIGMM